MRHRTQLSWVPFPSSVQNRFDTFDNWYRLSLDCSLKGTIVKEWEAALKSWKRWCKFKVKKVPPANQYVYVFPFETFLFGSVGSWALIHPKPHLKVDHFDRRFCTPVKTNWLRYHPSPFPSKISLKAFIRKHKRCRLSNGSDPFNGKEGEGNAWEPLSQRRKNFISSSLMVGTTKLSVWLMGCRVEVSEVTCSFHTGCDARKAKWPLIRIWMPWINHGSRCPETSKKTCSGKRTFCARWMVPAGVR